MFLLISMLNNVCHFIIYYSYTNAMKKEGFYADVLCYSNNYLILL